MLRLSKLADYSVVILATMAARKDGLMTAIHLSETTGLPAPTVAKLLKKLAKSGHVQATRGAAGGYRLLQDPKTVTAASIIEAIDGPIKIIGCINGVACGHEKTCIIHGRWDPINAAVQRAFSEVTLTDLIASHFPLQAGCDTGACNKAACGE